MFVTADDVLKIQVIANPKNLEIGGLRGTLFGWSHWRYYSLAHVGIRFIHKFWVSAHGSLPSLSDPDTSSRLDDLIDAAQRYKSDPNAFVYNDPTRDTADIPSSSSTAAVPANTAPPPPPAAVRKQSISESVLTWVDTTAAHGAERLFNSG
jgi:glycerophosphoryl diester phosphodiesterase/phosphatidylglycerol phospholipase C